MKSKEAYLYAIGEAERFIQRAKAAVADIEQYHADKESGVTYPHLSNKNSAAAKRSSMDLTRALVHVRK